jgi:hypothetical protein
MPKKYEEGDKSRYDIIKFTNQNHAFKHPVAVYLDFESTLEQVSIRDDQKENINYIPNENSTTKTLQKHVANSCGLKFNCIHNQFSKPLKIFNDSNEDSLLESTINELEGLAKVSYNLFFIIYFDCY